MMHNKFDVLGIGNAIVDILVQVDDDFLKRENIAKSGMHLVDAETSARLYSKLGQAVECSGGSAGNTIAGLASLGSKAAYIGKIHQDQLGAVFSHDVKSLGVVFNTAPDSDGQPTATSLVMVTPDAERTMCTFLGACVNLTEDDIDENMVANSSITYMEGYLWDPENAKAAFRKAIKVAHKADQLTSLSLSDSFCVERHHDEFLGLVENNIDILFANEDEILRLYDTDDFDIAAKQAQKHCDITAITRGAEGCVIISKDDIIAVSGRPVSNLVDTTGAGDLFAAGFLHGLTKGLDLRTCGAMGNLTASEVITHLGARPNVNLRDYVSNNL